MEFNARYTLIALFTLLTIAAGFAFVYWLNNTGGFGLKNQYQIQFSVPVSGMATGANVLFNGIKVGEVTGLQFDHQNPERLIAQISVSPHTPIRQDTIAGVDFQGLTGAANILLTGGAADSPKLVSSPNDLATIVADPINSRSWTQNAARVLARIDDLFGRNDDRFDSILAGLERMTGGEKNSKSPLYDLVAPNDFTKPGEKPSWRLVVSEPNVVLTLNTDNILKQDIKDQWTALEDARWTDNLPNLLQARIIQGFENAGYVEQVLRPSDALDPQYRLMIDIRTFHFQSFATPQAAIDLMVKIIDRDGAIISSRHMQSSVPVKSPQNAAIIAALAQAFSSTTTQLIEWSVSSLN